MNLPENTKTITPIDQKRKNPLRKFEKPKINTKFFAPETFAVNLPRIYSRQIYSKGFGRRPKPLR